MEGEIGAVAWFLGIGIGIVALGVVLAAGSMLWNRRRLSSNEKARQQEKVDELYERDKAGAHRRAEGR